MNAVKLEKKREKPQNLLFYLLLLRVGCVCVLGVLTQLQGFDQSAGSQFCAISGQYL